MDKLNNDESYCKKKNIYIIFSKFLNFDKNLRTLGKILFFLSYKSSYMLDKNKNRRVWW